MRKMGNQYIVSHDLRAEKRKEIWQAIAAGVGMLVMMAVAGGTFPY